MTGGKSTPGGPATTGAAAPPAKKARVEPSTMADEVGKKESVDQGSEKLECFYGGSDHHLPLETRTDAGKGCVIKCAEKNTWSPNRHGAYRRNAYVHIFQERPDKATHYLVDPARVAAEKQRKGGTLPDFLKIGTTEMVGPAANLKDWIAGYTLAVVQSGPSKGQTVMREIKDAYKTAFVPYGNNAHHMVPWDAIKRKLQSHQGECVMFSGYNINEGDNLIFLPTTKPYGRIMRLPRHPTDHPEYTKKVAKQLGKIKKYIKKDPHPTDDELMSIKSSLQSFQEDLFKCLIKQGKVDSPPKVDKCDVCELMTSNLK